MINEILDEMGTRLRDAYAGLDLGGTTVQVEPRLTLNVTPPSIDMWSGDPVGVRDPDTAGFGEVEGGIFFTIRIRVGTADHKAGQDLANQFLDETHELCIAVPLLDEPTLNGWASSLHLGPPIGPNQYPEGDSGVLLGYQWRVLVLPAFS